MRDGLWRLPSMYLPSQTSSVIREEKPEFLGKSVQESLSVVLWIRK